MDAEHPTASQPNPRRSALRLGAVAGIVAVIGVAFALLPHGKTTAPPVATIAPTLPPLSHAPVIGLGFSAAADPASHQVVLFGGINSNARTWLLDDQQWTLAHPTSSPTDRSGAVAAYDPVTKRVMLFGGSLATGHGVNDTWAWNGSTWLRLDSGANGPPAGGGAQMAWDDEAGEMVLVTEGETANTAETWVWTDRQRNSHWLRAPLGDLIVSVFGDVMAYDPSTQSVLLVSPITPEGVGSIAMTWDGKAWIQSTRGPDLRAMAYYPGDSSLFACGLATYSESVEIESDCWEWTGASWSQKESSDPPPNSKQMVIEAEISDADNSRLIMFGWLIRAIPGQPQPLGAWTWNGRQWLLLG